MDAMQNESASCTGPLPSDLGGRLSRLRAERGTAKATAAALGCSV